MRLPSGERSTEWVKRLPSVVAALNGEVIRLTDRKPNDAIKAKTLTQKPPSVVPRRLLGLKEQKSPRGSGFAIFTRSVNEGGCEALFAKKTCLRCHPTHIYHRMRSSGVGQLFNPTATSRIPVSICQRVHPISDPALGIKG